MTDSNLVESCRTYISTRTASYAQRLTRFHAAYDRMLSLNLRVGDVVMDLGAGHCDFDYFLRHDKEWRGIYVPVDGALGTDLNHWYPSVKVDFIVCMETLEHLADTMTVRTLLTRINYAATKGVIITVPNPEAVDVLGCDPDHKTVVPANLLREYGHRVEVRSFFGQPFDSLLAWKGGDDGKDSYCRLVRHQR